MKPKIQLAGAGASSSFSNDGRYGYVPESDVEGSAGAARSTSLLIEEFLSLIIHAVGANAGIVRVLSPDGLTLRKISSAGLADVCQSESVVDSGCGACGKAASGQMVEVSDVDLCRNRFGADFFSQSCNAILAVALGGSEKFQPLGVLTLFFSAQKNITDEIRRSSKTYADLMNAALRNIWKSEDEHQESLLAERQSIANEIHDSLAQTLYYAKIRSSLMLDAMKSENDDLAYKCAQDIDEALEGSQRTVRELVTHFRCQMDPRGLRYALQKLVNDFAVRTRIDFEYEEPPEEFNLPLETELQVFLIVRESLTNIATHSGATIARLAVSRDDRQFKFVIVDNGGGVPSDAAAEGHYGLEIMHERALRIGGEVVVESLQGLGTRVQLLFNGPGNPLETKPE